LITSVYRDYHWPSFDRVFSGMRMAVGAMALEDNNIIVDDVMMAQYDQQLYLQSMPEHKPIFIGLFAPLDIMEKREKLRGDRLIGLARWQFEQVHKGIAYDLEIDNSKLTAEECAQQIAVKFNI
jgi:chloramphenicol 3-O phosphotransferase